MAENGGDFSQRKPAGGQRFWGGHSVDLEVSITLIDLKGKAEYWAEV